MNLAPHILANGNWISMEEFMEIALYDAEGGYYNNNIADIGFRGDFSTTATMSDLLARRLVQQWEMSCKAFNRRLPIIDIGGGNGDMAVSMARSLGFFNRLRVRYYMVDRSKALRDLQLMVGGNFVRVYETVEKAIKHAGGRAFIFSNELPDAFPARQFVFQDGKWLRSTQYLAVGYPELVGSNQSIWAWNDYEDVVDSVYTGDIIPEDRYLNKEKN